MTEEQWIVRNNTSGPLILPNNKLTFSKCGQEKELCFLTNKTISELERDQEIKMNLSHKNIITVFKTEKPVSDTDTEGISNKLEDLKKLILDSSQNVQIIEKEASAPQVDISQIVDAIKGQININIGSESGENVVSLEDEKMKEEAIKQLVFRKDDLKKNLQNMGSTKQIKNESEGNEDLLDDIEI